MAVFQYHQGGSKNVKFLQILGNPGTVTDILTPNEDTLIKLPNLHEILPVALPWASPRFHRCDLWVTERLMNLSSTTQSVREGNQHSITDPCVGWAPAQDIWILQNPGRIAWEKAWWVLGIEASCLPFEQFKETPSKDFNHKLSDKVSVLWGKVLFLMRTYWYHMQFLSE